MSSTGLDLFFDQWRIDEDSSVDSCWAHLEAAHLELLFNAG